MNFLAHIYLSGKDEDLIIGNFIADSVKGKRYLNYPPRIQKGIILHRAIDFYTDTHPVVRKSSSRLFANYRHYSSVIVDIFYDHFLASKWSDYSDEPLEDYIANFYLLLEKNISLLPAPVQRFFPYMIEENWLLSYSSTAGIKKILYQMNRRTQGKSRMDLAVADLKRLYREFETDFEEFFPDLQNFSQQKIDSL